MAPAIDHINRYVSDVDAHVDFYREVLGYRLIDRGVKKDGSRYAILMGNGHELFISERGDCSPGTSLRHIGYAVEDVEEKLRELKRWGHVGEDAAIIVKRYSRQLYVRDPDGLEVDLIQWTDKKGFYEDAEGRRGDLV